MSLEMSDFHICPQVTAGCDCGFTPFQYGSMAGRGNPAMPCNICMPLPNFLYLHISLLNGVRMKMSAATSPRGIDGPSYFTTVHQRVVPEPDTPSVSPTSHPPPTPPRPSRLLRPPVRPHSKARSEDISGYSRSTVQSIPEDEASQNRTLHSFIETPPYKGSRTSASRTSALTSTSDGGDSIRQRAPQSIATSQSSSSFASIRSITRRYLQRFNSTPQQHPTTPISTTRSGGHRRARSESGRKRARSSTSLPRRKTRSAENLARRRFRNSSESHRGTSSAPSAPLRPPVSTKLRDRDPADCHDIKIETPFTPHSKDDSELPVRSEQQSSRRSSSVHPRVIFASPLSIVRRFRKPPDTRPTLSSQRSSSPSVPEAHRIMLSHMSQLRRKRTHEALRQVSQLLRLIAGDKPESLAGEHKPATSRTMSNKSTPSMKELKEGRKLSRKPTQGLPPVPPRVPTQNSMELDLRGSDSSSIRMLRLGPPPNATPDEHATYKIKRSPSAETEEFLKVDISIRGGTSYLPSEARRIHTPPLPSEGADGRRRGFFFDYNAPRLRSIHEAKPNVGASTEGKPSVGPESGVGKGKAKSGEERPVSAGTTTTVDRGTYRTLRTGKKNRGAEWYDTKLAELDASTDEETLDKENPGHDSVSSSFYEMRQRTERALLEMRTRHAKSSDSEVVAQEDPADFPGQEVDDKEEEEEEDEIDHNVPEHYPTSPLCPANVKYWRFVDGKLGKGRYTRTCWMHGDLQNQN